jgi:hypothetical protein
LPVVIWSRLYHDLEPYLSWRSANGTALMVFFHTRFNEVADRLFLRDDTVRSARHGSLATYFRDLADPERNQTWKGDNARPFLQVVFHLVRAQRTDDYCQTLCDLRFVEARCRVEQVFELIADYRLAQKNLPEAQADLEEERRRRERITRYTSDLIAYAKAWSERRDRIARGERVSEPEPEPPTPPPSCRMWTEAEIETECQRIIGTPKRLDRLRAFAGFVESQCYRLIEFGKHSGFVPQHAFSTEPAGLVHDASVLLLAALKEPHLLRDWPPNAVHNPKPACLRTLAGHRVGINSVSVTPEGGRAVSGGADHTLRVWDLESGVCLRTLEGHSDGVNSVSVTQDGRRIVSGGNDGMVRVWDVESGTCLRPQRERDSAWPARRVH